MVEIRHLEEKKYEASNGKEILIIDAEKYSPVDLFITGLGNCSLYDVVEMGKKHNIRNVTMNIEFKRRETFPKIFTEFHFIYLFESDTDNLTAKRWVLSSLETYCSTINTVRNTSRIYYTVIHNGDTIAYKEMILSGQVETSDDEFEDEDFGCVA